MCDSTCEHPLSGTHVPAAVCNCACLAVSRCPTTVGMGAHQVCLVVCHGKNTTDIFELRLTYMARSVCQQDGSGVCLQGIPPPSQLSSNLLQHMYEQSSSVCVQSPHARELSAMTDGPHGPHIVSHIVPVADQCVLTHALRPVVVHTAYATARSCPSQAGQAICVAAHTTGCCHGC